MGLINETLENNDRRELPSETGPRGVDTSGPLDGPGGLKVRSEAELQQTVQGQESDIERLLNGEVGTPGDVPEPNLTPMPTGNPLMDPGTYSDAFTREAQDRASAVQGIQGYVPTYAGSTYDVPDSTPNIGGVGYDRSAFLNRAEQAQTPAPAPVGMYTEDGVLVPEEFEQYIPYINSELSAQRARGLNTRPTRNVTEQSAQGVAGLLGLGTRAVRGLFKGADRAGELVGGEDDESRGFFGRLAKDAKDLALGSSPLAAMLNPEYRKAFVEGFGSEFQNLSARNQEAIRQLSPTNGAGNAGKDGPLSGDFGEYGTGLLGGLNYTLDGLGNQFRANIAARRETGVLFNPVFNQELKNRLSEAARRNARAAWMGKDFSFLNPDGPNSVFNKDAPRTWSKTPFKVVGGVFLDTVTGPDPFDIIAGLRRSAGGAQDGVTRAARSVDAPTTPTSSAIVLAQPNAIKSTRIELDARPYPPGLPAIGLPPGKQGGSLARTTDAASDLARRSQDSSALVRNVIELDPYPVPLRLPAIGLPPGRPIKALPGVPPLPSLPPGGGVDMRVLLRVPPNSPQLDAIRVIPDVSSLGRVDPNPGMARPLSPPELQDVLDSSVAGLPTLDLNTGRVVQAPVPDPIVITPSPEDIFTPDDISTQLDDLDIIDVTPIESPQRATPQPQQAPSPTPEVQTPSQIVESPSRGAQDDLVYSEPGGEDFFPGEDMMDRRIQEMGLDDGPAPTPDTADDMVYLEPGSEDLMPDEGMMGLDGDTVTPPPNSTDDMVYTEPGAEDFAPDEGMMELMMGADDTPVPPRARPGTTPVPDLAGPDATPVPPRAQPGATPRPPRAQPDVEDEFAKFARSNPEALAKDIDGPQKAIQYGEASGVVVTTNNGALVRSDKVVAAAQKKLIDLRIKQQLALEASRDMGRSALARDIARARANALQEGINDLRTTITGRPLRKPSPNILSGDELDAIVPAVTVEQMTPVKRAAQVIQDLRTKDLLSQAFDLKAVERNRIVRRTQRELEAMARFMNHWTSTTIPTWADLQMLHSKHGLYAVNGPALDERVLNDAVEKGLRRIEQVEPNELLDLPGQTVVVRSTPQIMGNTYNRAVLKAQDILGGESTGLLIRGEPLSDDAFRELVETWRKTGGRSDERRQLNAVMKGYQPTPAQVAAIKDTYGVLTKKEQAKLPKGIRDILSGELPPTTQVVRDAGNSVERELLAGPDMEELIAEAMPTELRDANTEALAELSKAKQESLGIRQSLVEYESDLAQVQTLQAQLYQELSELPELEPRSIMDGTWENGRLNERAMGVVEALNNPPPRPAQAMSSPNAAIGADGPEAAFEAAANQLMDKHENFIPIYELRDALNLPRKEFDAVLYRLWREDRIEVSTLQEMVLYTDAQKAAGIPQNIGGSLFFIQLEPAAINKGASTAPIPTPTPTPSLPTVNVSLDGDWYTGTPFGVDDPRNLPLGSSSPLRGVLPPGFLVVSNDPRLAKSSALARVPDNTTVNPNVGLNPVVDKVYLTQENLIDGDALLSGTDYEEMLTSLTVSVSPSKTKVLNKLLKDAKLEEVPLGRVMNRLQDSWGKLYPTKQVDDLLFGELAVGYQQYIQSKGGGMVLNIQPNRQVVLLSDPNTHLASQFARTTQDAVSPTQAALHRTYVDGVLGEPDSLLSSVLNTNNRNQHALEMAEELQGQVSKTNVELGKSLTNESRLRDQAEAISRRAREEAQAQLQVRQDKRLKMELDQIDERGSSRCL